MRRETLDAITGGTEFNPQPTGRGSMGTRLERKDLRQGFVRSEENANRHAYVGHKRTDQSFFSFTQTK